MAILMSSILYITASISGLALLVVSGGSNAAPIDVIYGMGAVILGVMGLEAQAIKKTIMESKEVR